MYKKCVVISLLFMAIFAVILRSAWIGDDAFITLRTVDNWVHGYGLVWNVGERIQVYTHPLWMFLLAGTYLMIPAGYLAVMSLSLITSSIVFLLFLYHHKDDTLILLFGILALMLSKAFMDYSTSGLENPLTHLLALIFTVTFIRSKFPVQGSRFFWLVSIAGLSALNRLDTLLLFIPALLYLYSKAPEKPKQILPIAAGFLPLILWECFSLFYYGFPIPNTAYAKLSAGIPMLLLYGQGLKYFLNSIAWDPITLSIVAFSSLLVVLQKRTRETMLVIGMVFYLFYVLSIGGDFMSGRFFSTVYLISLVLFIQGIQPFNPFAKYVLAVFALLPGILSPASPLTYFIDPLGGLKLESMKQSLDGIADERSFYYQTNGLLMMDDSFEPDHPWAGKGKGYRTEHKKIAIESVVGMIGYYAGPQTYVIDVLALGDPFLARLETRSNTWRIGHFERPLVPGYVATIQSGDNQITDPWLAQYYDKLKIIISGDLWSLERLELIWKMNTGQYDHLTVGYAG